jgi:hypothetical protein
MSTQHGSRVVSTRSGVEIDASTSAQTPPLEFDDGAPSDVLRGHRSH